MTGPEITLEFGSRGHSSSGRSASPTDEEDSSGTGVHLSTSSAHDSQGYPEEYTEEEDRDDRDDWEQVDQADLVSADSAARPALASRRRIIGDSRHPPELLARRSARGVASHSHLDHHSARAHRQLHPSSSESVDSNEDLSAYGSDPVALRQRRPYVHWTPAQGPGGPVPYASSHSSHSYGHYPVMPPSGQNVVPFVSPSSQYAYYPHSQGAPGYYPHGAPGVAPLPHPMAPPSLPPFSGDGLHHGPGYFSYPSGYPLPHQIAHSPYHAYAPVFPSPAPGQAPPVSLAAGNDNADQLEELKKLYLEDRAEREAREAAAKLAAEAAKAQAEQDQKVAEASAAAAAAARSEAEKKAEEKAKVEAEAAAAAAAVAAAMMSAAPEEKKKPIKFKDAVGRKFSFPFDLCKTWEGIEDLIRQAFLHVDIIGPHVVEGHYDLIGPDGDIILPRVWDTVIEPDWTITMHMWPMPEPKEDELAIDVPLLPPPLEDKKKGKSKNKGKTTAPPPAAPTVPPPIPDDGVIDVPISKKKSTKSSSPWLFGSRPKPKAKATAKKT